MWISNTATTAMMIPIVTAVTDEMRNGAENAAAAGILDDDPGMIQLSSHIYWNCVFFIFESRKIFLV
jgi:di/tricarboxylate transporter